VPPIPGYPNSLPNITVPDGVTFKLVHKNGWHTCVEDPGVLCKGPYTVNETIQRYQNLGPPPAPRLPQAYILPATALPPTSSAKNNGNSGSSDVNITHTLPDGTTFKLIHIHKNGLHLCPDAPDVICNGPYIINQTIVDNQPPPQNLTFPSHPPVPPQNLTPGVVPPPVLPPSLPP